MWTRRTIRKTVVAGWLGHSPLIAAKHYLQTRDAHFDLAAGLASGASPDLDPKSGAESGAQEAQNAAQHPTAPDRTGSPESSEVSCVSGVVRADANECDAAAGEESGRYWTRTPPLFSGESEQCWFGRQQFRQHRGPCRVGGPH